MQKKEFDIKILIATHKKYCMPSDEIYLPLQVGSEGKVDLGYTPDNTKENISDKNSSFCELTGLYWGWKNLECDYIGLAHYRRHFTLKRNKNLLLKKKDVPEKMDYVLNKDEISKLIPKYDIIVPAKRRYYIESLYTHYEHTHYKEHLDVTRDIIQDSYPEYINGFDSTMKKRSGYMFNMYIMKKELSDEYCEWLFKVLFELEKRIGTPELSRFQGRFYGRVSEILFNVWLAYKMEQVNISIKEIGCMHMDNINWWNKGTAFLKAKFLSVKYEGSF